MTERFWVRHELSRVIVCALVAGVLVTSAAAARPTALAPQVAVATAPPVAATALPVEPAGSRVVLPSSDPLSELERIAGWEPLFSTDSLEGWQASGVVGPEGWSIQAGVVHLAAGGLGGNLLSEREFLDFELEFEWKVAAGANSGVKYRVMRGVPPRGPEYQVLDNRLHPNGADALHSAAALYDLYPSPHDEHRTPRELRDPAEPAARAEATARAAAAGRALAAEGAPAESGFHQARIVARGTRLEHWIDGRRVLVAEVGSEDWRARLASSKFASQPDFGTRRGPILLQDHQDEVWYRNLRIRDLESLPGDVVALDTGAELRGWRALGDARYVGDGRSILGEVDGGAQSFLITERSFGDFLLEVDVRAELPGNSGIQVRSQVHPDTGRLFGYQLEIDSSERAWSGGLYDEGRRGWLDDLDDNPAGRAAFVPGDWNRYRIECVGASIRAWVNGVPTADVFDGADQRGVIGLQVHSGDDTRVRWRDLSLRDLGEHAWTSMLDELARDSARVIGWEPRPNGGLVAGAKGAGLSPPGDFLADGSWRFTLQSESPGSLGGWFIGSGTPEVLVPNEAVSWDRGAWQLDLAGGEVRVLELHLFGARQVGVLDGALLFERRGAPGIGGAPSTGGVPAADGVPEARRAPAAGGAAGSAGAPSHPVHSALFATAGVAVLDVERLTRVR